MKKVRPRPEAQADVEQTALYHAEQSLKASHLFIAEYKMAVAAIGRMPGLGSPRLSQELNIEGLRTFPLAVFPYVLLYFERERHIDLARIMHTHRDLSMFLG